MTGLNTVHVFGCVKKKTPAFASIILLGGGLVMVMAIIGLVISFNGVVDKTYLDLALLTPGFDYSIGPDGETGNETFKVYKQMRDIGYVLFALLMIIAAVSKVLEASDTGMVTPGTASRIISKGMMAILIMMVFPPMWDGAAEITEGVALWILNPLYSFDEENPCPADWTAERIQQEYDNSPYKHGTQDPESVCRPEFKVQYVFGQMLRQTEVALAKEELGIISPNVNGTDVLDIGGEIIEDAQVELGTNWTGGLVDKVLHGTEGVFTNLFLGLTKALVSIQVLIMSLLLGVMADMLTGLVIAGLPVFLMLSLIPKAEGIANKFIETIPALLLLPVMSAIILAVGAGTIVEAGVRAAEDMDGWSHIYSWITSVGVVFFAITLPTLMIPLLGSVTQMAQQVVSSAVSSGAMITGMAASGMAGSAVAAHRQGMGFGRGVGMAALGGVKGAVAGHHSLGVPGIPMPPASDLKGGFDEATKYPSIKEQKQMVLKAIDASEARAHTKEHGMEMYNAGVTTHAWDDSMTAEENHKMIDKGMVKEESGDVKGKIKTEENIEEGTGTSKPDKRKIMAQEAYDGPVKTALKKGATLNEANLGATASHLRDEDKLKGVTDKAMHEALVKRAGEESHIPDKKLEKMIKKNTENIPLGSKGGIADSSQKRLKE